MERLRKGQIESRLEGGEGTDAVGLEGKHFAVVASNDGKATRG